ncbi:sulfate ABC transporter permease subunit CysT [Haloferula sp. BvORR071]|uniref:sulfate ABC transporter permease subunit CysT n=1 Tax=Haloferula sp. BvORR071 TaxID=1396141 RepID=UPI00055320CA|nr:sulfate ABC transporter permease subunit CysT [Haloferula sp. BvORR071]
MAKQRVIPGFGLSLGITITWLSLIILIPLAALFIKAAGLGPDDWKKILTSPQVLAAAKLTFGASAAAAAVSVVIGLLTAWVLVRYDFPGRKILDAMVDLPFALPTAVAGITLTSIYAPNGWIGQYLEAWGIKVAYTPTGVWVALTFIGFPFVVRTVQPVMEDLALELEEAAASLGANRWTTFRRVIFPMLVPALITGFTLAFARAIGEYGSVIFISGNLPMKTEILPRLIVSQLEQYKYEAAAVIASGMLIVSFALLFLINLLQRRLNWQAR